MTIYSTTITPSALIHAYRASSGSTKPCIDDNTEIEAALIPSRVNDEMQAIRGNAVCLPEVSKTSS